MMKKLLIAVVLIAFFVPVVSAKEDEPDPFPKWLTPYCFHIVATIVQHEVGFVPSIEAKRFVASQVLRDAEKMGCDNLTQWRWAIRSRPRPSLEVLTIVASLPQYPKCRFVGNATDVTVWRSYGYRAQIDYEFKSGKFTVIGADCETTSIRPTHPARRHTQYDR